MILYDTHMHTDFSTDSDTPLEAQLQRAAELSLKGVCVTDHMDYDFPTEQTDSSDSDNMVDFSDSDSTADSSYSDNASDVPDSSGTVDFAPYTFDLAQQKKELVKFRGKYPSLRILSGVECGLQNTPSVLEKNSRLCADEELDYVIGSLHLVDREDPYYPAYWEGQDAGARIRRYLELLYENIQAFSCFDALGHLDYIARYAPRAYSYHPAAFRDIIEEILRLLIRRDVALELNTAGFKNTPFTNPHPVILDWYRQMGGELITVGSDAHSPAYIALSFDRAAAILRQAGFREYAVYQQRKPVFYPL